MTKGVSLEQVREGLPAHPTFILVFPLLDRLDFKAMLRP
jgi:hypothetical protein